MSPSLWPDLAHLPVWLVVICIAILSIGLGSWTGARRAETALVAGWGVASAATVVAGTLLQSGLAMVMLALAAAGLAGLIRRAATLQAAMLGRVVLLALPLAVCIEGMDVTGWDDFSHWLPNLTYLCLHNHFPTLNEPGTSAHAAYPYGLALPGYGYFLLFGGVPTTAALVWNVLLMLAAGSAVATILLARLQSTFPEQAGQSAQAWAAAAVGLLAAGIACPGFVAKIEFSNMADAPTASVLAVLGLLLFEWAAAVRDTDDRQRMRVVWAMAFASIALVNLREPNAALFAWLMFGALLAGATRRRWLGVPELASLALIVALPFAVWLLWDRYASAQIPGGQFEFLPFRGWRWTEFPGTLHSMVRVMLSKFGLFGVILLIAMRAGLAFRQRDELESPQRMVLIVAATVCLANIVFLAFTYLTADFYESEAVAAISFWRYVTQTGPLAMLGLIAAMPLGWMRRIPAVPAAIALVALALILPVATVRFYRFDLASSVPMLRAEGKATAEAIAPAAPIALVDLTGDGFAPLVAAYQLRSTDIARGVPARAVTIIARATGIPANDAAKLDFTAAPYLWLAEGAPELERLFGIRLAAGCSYLLRRQDSSFAIVKTWPLSPYLRNVQRDGWSPPTGAPCT